MLARPEPGTREHILLWLASQPPEREYRWRNTIECACGIYAREAMGKSNLWWTVQTHIEYSPFSKLNILAMPFPHTFGALYERAQAAWK